MRIREARRQDEAPSRGPTGHGGISIHRSRERCVVSVSLLAPPLPRGSDSSARRKAESYELRLARRWRDEEDLDARSELIQRLMPLAANLARRYANSAADYDDLVQVASLGLIKAIDRYEPDRGKLTSFAVPTILGELKRHLRDKTWALHLPRQVQERCLTVSRVTEDLTAQLERPPTVTELVEATGLSPEQLLEAKEAKAAHGAGSLDAGVGDSNSSEAMIDLLGEHDPGFDLVEERQSIQDCWSRLAPLEQEVVRLRFTEDLTQREIGAMIGYSQMHVSRLLRHALSRLEPATSG